MSAKVVEILSPEIRRTLTRLASQVVEKSRDLSQLVILVFIPEVFHSAAVGSSD